MRALFALQFRHLLADGFPAVTTKKLFFDKVVGELLWFLEGSTDDNRLMEILGLPAKSRTMWSENAKAPWWRHKAKFDGDLGRLYGAQWRSWRQPDGSSVDQIKRLVNGLRTTPHHRDHVVSAWNAGELHEMALNPCHMIFQCFVDDNKRLSLHMVQRAADLFHGVPFNIASYALLCHMLAQITDLVAHELVITFNDVHIYHEHLEAVDEQLQRTPLKLPTLSLNPLRKELEEFVPSDAKLSSYSHHPAISAPFIL